MGIKENYTTALVDVSIDSRSMDKHANSTGFYRVDGESLLDLGEEDVSGSISHGGQCLEYFAAGAGKPVDCFIHLRQDAYGQCNINDLITALKWCAEKKVSLISLSMGTVCYGDAIKLSDITERISRQGGCMVVSASNNRLLSYPACLKACIGVCGDYGLSLGLSRFTYLSRPFDGINVIINPYMKDENSLGSNSLSTAYFAGFLMKSLTEAGFGYSSARDWLEANSEPFEPRDLYAYSCNSIKVRCEDEPIIIAVEKMCNPLAEKLCRHLQNLFHEADYYCLTVYPKDKGENTCLTQGFSADRTNFALYTHQHLDSFHCTYEEYIRLIIQLCRPGAVIVDYDNYIEHNVADVILHYSDGPAAAENTLVLAIASHSPIEILNRVVDYFSVRE